MNNLPEPEDLSCNEWGPDYQPVMRPEGYYDLIELPNGRHVPAPIAERLIGEAIIERIPISRKHRNARFFYCPACDRMQTFVTEHGVVWVGPSQDGYSFFRCKLHKPCTIEENKAKESMLVRLILNGMYKSLRYVEAER